jgi:ProP effector
MTSDTPTPSAPEPHDAPKASQPLATAPATPAEGASATPNEGSEAGQAEASTETAGAPAVDGPVEAAVAPEDPPQAAPALASASAVDGENAAPEQPEAVAAAPAALAAPAAPSMDLEACTAALKQRFPALFTGGPRPIKLRIQADIQERAPGVFTRQSLSAFLRRYTGSTSYLIALGKATHRFDLDGQPAGEITAEHHEAARANSNSSRNRAAATGPSCCAPSNPAR